MSRQKLGDLVPQLVEVMDKREGRLVHRWRVYGPMPENDRGFNCPAALEVADNQYDRDRVSLGSLLFPVQ